jgi:hypothetical protein
MWHSWGARLTPRPDVLILTLSSALRHVRSHSTCSVSAACHNIGVIGNLFSTIVDIRAVSPDDTSSSQHRKISTLHSETFQTSDSMRLLILAMFSVLGAFAAPLPVGT